MPFTAFAVKINKDRGFHKKKQDNGHPKKNWHYRETNQIKERGCQQGYITEITEQERYLLVFPGKFIFKKIIYSFKK